MNWMPILAGLVPSIGVGLLFWFVMRAVVRADRNERTALASGEGAADGPVRDSSAAGESPPQQG